MFVQVGARALSTVRLRKVLAYFPELELNKILSNTSNPLCRSHDRREGVLLSEL